MKLKVLRLVEATSLAKGRLPVGEVIRRTAAAVCARQYTTFDLEKPSICAAIRDLDLGAGDCLVDLETGYGCVVDAPHADGRLSWVEVPKNLLSVC